MNLVKILTGLKNVNGIYYTYNNSPISYPEDGNDNCFILEDNSFWFRHRNNCIIQVVKNFYESNKVFLDIGGGNGFVSKNLQSEGIKTILLEPGKNGVINAKKRGVKNIICGTLQSIKLPKKSISYAGIFDVLEHIEKETDFLKLIYEYLEDNGYLFITVPAYNFLWSREDVNAGHFRRYTIGCIGKELFNLGFKKVYSTYIFSFLPLPIFLFRTLPYKVGLRKIKNNSIKNEKDHCVSNGSWKRFLNFFLKSEFKRISNKKRIFFGGTCFVVVQK